MKPRMGPCKTCFYWYRPPIPEELRIQASAHENPEVLTKLEEMEQNAPGECRFDPPRVAAMMPKKAQGPTIAIAEGPAGPNGQQAARVPVHLQPITACADTPPDWFCGRWVPWDEGEFVGERDA